MLTDTKGRTWHALEREDGSISLYYTRAGVGAHFVVWDSLDVDAAQQRITSLEAAINTVLPELDDELMVGQADILRAALEVK